MFLLVWDWGTYGRQPSLRSCEEVSTVGQRCSEHGPIMPYSDGRAVGVVLGTPNESNLLASEFGVFLLYEACHCLSEVARVEECGVPEGHVVEGLIDRAAIARPEDGLRSLNGQR